MGEGFVELEPFEHERHASGSRFNLKLELRTWNWSLLASRLKYDIKILNVPYDLIMFEDLKSFKNALSFVFVVVLVLHHKAVRK
jgi:hypothetical protein